MYARPRPSRALATSTQFDVDRNAEGHVVVDTTNGRPVTFLPLTADEARDRALVLNEAAADGRRSLALALGAAEATDDPEVAALAMVGL